MNYRDFDFIETLWNKRECGLVLSVIRTKVKSYNGIVLALDAAMLPINPNRRLSFEHECLLFWKR